MKKEKNESTGTTAAAATAKAEEKVLVAQQESISENEESDTITDHSSSMSEHKKGHTQFSVQRSDTDGLRMKISAIRTPTNSAPTTDTKRTKASIQKSAAPSLAAAATTTQSSSAVTVKILGDKVNNNTVVETLKIKLNSSSSGKKPTVTINSTTTNNNNNNSSSINSMSVDAYDEEDVDATPAAITSYVGGRGLKTAAASSKAADVKVPLTAPAPCLSDATESGCSEATTTTVAAPTEKSTKKVKVKRKKAQTKTNDAKSRSNKKSHISSCTFSSDSDDEPLQKLKQQQRAPRLLITAINPKSAHLKSLITLAGGNSTTSATANDNIGLSSSDNELPDLVSAAIKRVESDTDDTVGVECGVRLNTKTKNLPQYQSTLLQDFMEKTQMLGQTPAATPARVVTPEPIIQMSPVGAADKVSTKSNASFIDVASGNSSKKRRGRPKKSVTSTSILSLTAEAAEHFATAAAAIAVAPTININESADSGVISTTSTTQSTSPSPRLAASAQRKGGGSESVCVSPIKSFADLSASTSSTTAKPKIDFVNLDKRMYATERVLYPPPRNKRRQSTGINSGTAVPAQRAAAAQPGGEKKTANTAAASTSISLTTTNALAAKEELLLDPVWRKIDVNKKFRRPSVSGYKSDGGGGNTTICSKILAAKSGYVSDYGSAHPPRFHHHTSHNSGYKSDASCKSRYSTRSCASRRSRAKSCGYRSDYKDSEKGAALKSTKFRRKRRSASLLRQQSKSVGNLLNEDQDILQLAGLSLGQSSEESNEYVCKPSLECLPITSVSKKYGEINRYIATGEYFGRGESKSKSRLFDTAHEDGGSQDGFHSFSGKMNLLRKNSLGSELATDLLSQMSRKIKSRRSSAASYCSSYYSGVSKVKRRRRRKSFRFPTSSKVATIDSKLLTEIEIITNTFGSLCRIQNGDKTGIAPAAKDKDKTFADANSSKFQSLSSGVSGSTKRESRDKRSLKKRKLSESVDFALLSASVGSLTPSSGSTKRRHKKANSSSPDDHKLPLKKRHYLLTPGEKSTEAAAVAKLFANNAEALAAAAAAAKSSATSLAIASNTQQQLQHKFSTKSSKPAITPKKRHLLQNSAPHSDENSSVKGGSNCSPLRINVIETSSMLGGKLLDISPLSTSSVRQITDPTIHKKRSRLEGVVSKIASHSDAVALPHSVLVVKEFAAATTPKSGGINSPQVDSETSCPPPGVFEPTVELEIQIPPIAKLSEAAAIITKSEVDSPLLLELNKTFPLPTTKIESSTRVVEDLLNKTGGNLILKRKRKKFNRTGFPTVRRKKRKIHENLLLDVTPDIAEQTQKVRDAATPTILRKFKSAPSLSALKMCDRVPQTGEDSDTFLERANRAPRLSVVSLERLQGTAAISTNANDITKEISNKEALTESGKRGKQKKQRLQKETVKEREKSNQRQKELEKNKTADKEKETLRGTEKLKSIEKSKEKPKKNVKEILKDGKEKSKTVEAPVPKAPRQTKTNKAHAVEIELQGESPVHIRSARARKSKSAFETDVPIIMAPNQNRKSQIDKSTKSTEKIKKSTASNGLLSTKELEAKRLLPAGIDPKINFSCKIRLKRRSSLHPMAIIRKDADDEDESLTAVITKDPHVADQLEHDVLPMTNIAGAVDSETASDTSDEKSSSASTAGGRKNARWRKTYLSAGLFSDFFKCLQTPPLQKVTAAAATLSKRNEKSENNVTNDKKELVPFSATATVACETMPTLATPLLPPPPYCEKHFRRTQIDFELPFDIWWAYKNSKLPARVTVPSWNYRKIRTNIYAESVRPNLAGFDHPTCNCKSDIGCGDDCLNRLVYTECSPSSCPTRDKCRNQKIQRHEIAPGVERFMTENKGWGVRNKLPIRKGTYIMEYVGEVVTEREFKDRMGTIYLNDIHHYCLHLDGGLVIDGHRMGSDGRFVNHSCEPNCEMQKWSVNGLSRMALFAARYIKVGEELTYDYNFSLFNPSEGQPCRCNTPQCRGVIGGKSQRIKPLPPIEPKPPTETSSKEAARIGRQRKRKAKKSLVHLQSRDIVFARVQQLSEKDKKYIKQHGVFLLRNFEKIRKIKSKRGLIPKTPPQSELKTYTPFTPVSPSTSPVAITNRRPSTPASLAAQISALRSPRNMKTRGLTMAVQDPELEKMAKMAVILRDICTALNSLKDPTDDRNSLMALVFAASIAAAAGNKKKKIARSLQKDIMQQDFYTIQANVEKGFYKQASDFDAEIKSTFEQAKELHKNDDSKLKALDTLCEAYNQKKLESAKQLLELVGEEACNVFVGIDHIPSSVVTLKLEENYKTTFVGDDKSESSCGSGTKNSVNENASDTENNQLILPTEDIIRCICGLYKDEGLMIQCARCMVWQHTECTKADIDADNYHCERCEPRLVNREIPLEEFTEDGYRYYLSLIRGDLHIRQSDTVYVLRDIPVKDANGKVVPSQKHTYETIGQIDFSECDIFRVERLWKNNDGKRFIFGHHFLRPHETFHEPTRRFYPNEVVRVPLYEVVPIELVIGRCWVLDRTTFCKGRPMECKNEEHCYICELRVDKSARFFSKAKVNYPTCTKNYAFRKFPEKLKITKTYAPHDVDPAMLKAKKQKTDLDLVATTTTSTSSTPLAIQLSGQNEANKTQQNIKKRQSSNSPATVIVIKPVAPTVQTIKAKRSRLENVLKAMKLKTKNTQLTCEPPLDLSYLLSGRGARQRKTITSAAAMSSSVNVPA